MANKLSEAANSKLSAAENALENGDKPAGYLIGGTAAVAGVFTTLQITGNLFSRMLANHPLLVGAAFVLAIVAASLAWITLIFDWKKNKRLLLVGVVLLLGGTTCAVIAALLVSTDHPKPTVAITRLQEGELEATVKLTNVKTDETVRVRVEPLAAKGETYHLATTKALRSIYEAAFGPDASGNVDQTIAVQLPNIAFTHVGVRAWVGQEGEDCYSEASKSTGCVTREVVFRHERPQLTASWDFADSQPRLVIHVSGQGLRRTGYGYLRVRPAGDGDDIASWAIAANLSGSFERTLQIRIPPNVRAVCVQASMIGLPDETCGELATEEMSWVTLAVPEQ
jgi:hypothetical protein